MECKCPMRDDAHEAVCGHVGEYEYVHCLDCDKPMWMCEVAESRCRECRTKYHNSPEYKERLEQFMQDYLKGRG